MDDIFINFLDKIADIFIILNSMLEHNSIEYLIQLNQQILLLEQINFEIETQQFNTNIRQLIYQYRKIYDELRINPILFDRYNWIINRINWRNEFFFTLSLDIIIQDFSIFFKKITGFQPSLNFPQLYQRQLFKKRIRKNDILRLRMN